MSRANALLAATTAASGLVNARVGPANSPHISTKNDVNRTIFILMRVVYRRFLRKSHLNLLKYFGTGANLLAETVHNRNPQPRADFGFRNFNGKTVPAFGKDDFVAVIFFRHQLDAPANGLVLVNRDHDFVNGAQVSDNGGTVRFVHKLLGAFDQNLSVVVHNHNQPVSEL